MGVVGVYGSALNSAVQFSISTGISYMVAAGNDDADACAYSPAAVATALSSDTPMAAPHVAGSRRPGAPALPDSQVKAYLTAQATPVNNLRLLYVDTLL
ncbi:hypothetical protein ACIBJE_20555 [Micromonospora sp. NPDC050187]|uniref:hypothetical protein n=1 Tax=Micromonospora sp. NPDC050187 TaxID=3364277 RepID=UPI0037888010